MTADYSDLGATVLLGKMDEALAREAEDLYGSLFATLDYAEVYEHRAPDGVVLLDRPRHILPFSLSRGGIEILARNVAIPPADARRACRALFRTFPSARRIRIEVMFSPRALGLPLRELFSAEDMVVTLPGDLDSYLAGLGKSTRRNLRLYENRLRRAYPDLSTTVTSIGERAPELFETFMAWKRTRMAAKGELVYFDQLPDRVPSYIALLRRRGEVHLTTANGVPIALVLTFPVGSACWLHQYAYEPELEYYHLGLLSQYWVIADAIAHGRERVSMLWDTTYYKERLGARPVPATHVSVFPSHLARVHSLDEAVEVHGRRLRSRGVAVYWRTRHAAGDSVRRLQGRAEPASARVPQAVVAGEHPERADGSDQARSVL